MPGVGRLAKPDAEPSMTLTLEVDLPADLARCRLPEAVAAMEAIPEVLEADAISGPQDVICRVVARDTEHLQELVNQMLATPAIRRCTSYVVLTRQVPPRTGPLVTAAAK